MRKYLIILILCLNISTISAQRQHEQVAVEKVIATKDENGQVLLEFSLSVPAKTLGANDILIMTPVLITKDGDEQYPLSPIYAYGRVSALSARRKQILDKATGDTHVSIYNKDTLVYSSTFSYQSWMQTATLVMRSRLRNCCKERELPVRELYTCSFAKELPVKKTQVVITPKQPPVTLGITERLAQTEHFVEPVGNYIPRQKIVVGEQEEAQIIYFKWDKAEIDSEYSDNEKVLRHVIDVTRQIHNDPEVEIVHIVLLGLSSPEGLYLYNVKLAGLRCEAMKQYILSHISLPDSCFELVNGGEGWDELRYQVGKSEMSDKKEIIRIIDDIPILHGRETHLMKLNKGIPYRYMKEHFFPELRRAGYIKVYYRKKVPQ